MQMTLTKQADAVRCSILKHNNISNVVAHNQLKCHASVHLTVYGCKLEGRKIHIEH